MKRVCPACDYDLAGVTGGVCPECGARVGDGTKAPVAAMTVTGLTLVGYGWLVAIAGRALGSSYVYMPKANEGSYGDGSGASRLLQAPGLVVTAAGVGILACHHRSAGFHRRWPAVVAALASMVFIAGVTGWDIYADPSSPRWAQPLSWGLGGPSAFGVAVLVLAVASAHVLASASRPLGSDTTRRLLRLLVWGAWIALAVGLAAEAVLVIVQPAGQTPFRASTPPATPSYFATWHGQRLPTSMASFARYGVTLAAGVVAIALRTAWVCSREGDFNGPVKS